jgi:hypothetical protein
MSTINLNFNLEIKNQGLFYQSHCIFSLINFEKFINCFTKFIFLILLYYFKSFNFINRFNYRQ